MTSERNIWKNQSYESIVEDFYGKGVENYGDYHGGYLNFGLWENGNTNYIIAAENLVATLARSIDIDKKSKILDVACGLAAQDVYMHALFHCTIDAVDVTWKHVALGRKRVERAGYSKNVRIHHGTATKLNFPDDTFTHVMGIEGPAHFDTREDFFREAFRVLKPRGIIGLSDYILNRKPRNIIEQFFLEAACKLWHAPRENRDTAETYSLKLKRSGFVNITIKKIGRNVIPGYYFENKRDETIQAMKKIRGYFIAHAGRIIDYVMYKVFLIGVIEYVLVRAEKPK